MLKSWLRVPLIAINSAFPRIHSLASIIKRWCCESVCQTALCKVITLYSVMQSSLIPHSCTESVQNSFTKAFFMCVLFNSWLMDFSVMVVSQSFKSVTHSLHHSHSETFVTTLSGSSDLLFLMSITCVWSANCWAGFWSWQNTQDDESGATHRLRCVGSEWHALRHIHWPRSTT